MKPPGQGRREQAEKGNQQSRGVEQPEQNIPQLEPGEGGRLLLHQRSLEIDPADTHGLGGAATVLHEGKVADPELVMAFIAIGGAGLELTAEDVVALAGETGLLHGALQAGSIGFQKHGPQPGIVQSRDRPSQHLRLIALDIHLPNKRGG